MTSVTSVGTVGWEKSACRLPFMLALPVAPANRPVPPVKLRVPVTPKMPIGAGGWMIVVLPVYVPKI